LLAGEYSGPGSQFLYLHRIPELRQLVREGELLRIGAGLTYGELLARKEIPELLHTAITRIAAPAVRNAGTIGGNIANASPKGDAALVCCVTDCTLRLLSVRGERLVPIGEFYRGRGTTVREPDELLVEILMPTRWLAEDPAHLSFVFEKVGGRRALAISRVSFAGLMAVRDGRIAHLASAFGAVEDIIVRRPAIDALLIGSTLSEARARIPEWIAALSEALTPVRGRVSASYRKQVCLNLARAFVLECLEQHV
jgi:CO/xanthine dehydrogenase FAD-binding subunit